MKIKRSETFGDKVLRFCASLRFTGKVPAPFAVINPFVEHEETMRVAALFYKKFYGDHRPRRFIAGINPSRHGAGITGVPFTDTKRLFSACGIAINGFYSHEPSSVFLYRMIENYGGVEKFYGDYFINSPFPLAIIRKNEKGNWVNANYYDDPRLTKSLQPYMLQTLQQYADMGVRTETAWVLGKKNANFLRPMFSQLNLFQRVIELEHPRYIQQYKSKEAEFYIDKYIVELKNGIAD